MDNYSFVLCSRHYKKVLARVMDSVRTQSITGDEFVLVINQKDSSGYPEEFLNLFHKIIFSEAIGCGAVRHTGVLAASHEFIAFVDDDTELLLNWRQDSFSFLINPSVAFYQARRAGKLTLLDVKARKPFIFFFDTAGSVFRKTLIMAAGNFDRDLERCEDTDMATRIVYGGWDSAIGCLTVKDLEPESISYRIKRFVNTFKPNALIHLRAGLRLKHPSFFHLPIVVHKMGHSFFKRNTYDVLQTFIPVYIYQHKVNILGYTIVKRQKKVLLQFDGATYLLAGAGRIVFSEEGLTLIHIGKGSELFISSKDLSIEYNASFITIKIFSTDVLYKEFFLQSGVLTAI